MRNARFHREASEEIYRAGEYLEDQRPEYGDLFKAEIRSAFRELAIARERWPVRMLGYRKYLTTRFKYLIWYRETEEEIFVIAVHHSSRKPAYWKDRI